MPLKVLHITYTTSGGAGIAVLRLHKALLEQGIESKVLVGQTNIVSDDIVKATETMRGRYKVPNIPVLDKIIRALRRKGKCMTPMEKMEFELAKLDRKYPAYFDLPLSSFELEKHPLVAWADVINIHWISGYVDFPTFFANVKKPVVWTMHDLNPMYGGFHHVRLRDKFYFQYKFLEEYSYSIKRDALDSVPNLSVVAISNEMHELVSKHELFSKKHVYDIPNCIDPNQFSILNKEVVREILGWKRYKRYFLFVNRNLNDSEKGLDELANALDEIGNDDNILVCVGDGMVPKRKNLKTIYYHSVNDMIWLNVFYSAADFLVMPSHQESFGFTAVEALYCGTPVIMSKVGVAETIISDINGVLIENTDASGVISAINKALSLSYNPENIRRSAIDKYNPEKVAKQYMVLYDQILNKNHGYCLDI